MSLNNDRVLIIAEAGVNHNGSIELAKKLVDVAKESGVDIVKFQTFKADKLVTKSAAMAGYQRENIGSDTESQYDMLKRLELSYEEFADLSEYCAQKGVGFLSTPFDSQSIAFLANMGQRLWKIPSGEVSNRMYLEEIGRLGHEIILSTGMSEMEEVVAAIEVLVQAGTPRQSIKVLHCTSEYPAPIDEVNLLAIAEIGRVTGLTVGYSDHTEGIQVPIAATALGAKVIEKHFTLDRSMPGPDHRASIEPDELKEMVRSIRIVEEALGESRKYVTPSEAKTRLVARKSLHTAQAMAAGHIITADDLIAKRPGDGISPMEMYDVIGRVLIRNLKANEIIAWTDLKSE